MIVQQLGRQFKIVTGVALFMGMAAAPVMAKSIVDLKQPSPLGAFVVDKAEGVVLYSLGNGRAIKYSLQEVRISPEGATRRLLLRQVSKSARRKRVLRRRDRRSNIKWGR